MTETTTNDATGKEEIEVEQPPVASNESQKIHSYRLLYRFLPTGTVTLTVAAKDPAVVEISEAHGCSCCVHIHPINIDSATATVAHQPITCHCGRLVRDIALSFCLAFLFHLVPSVIWGPERSLGSPSNHQLMGVVWFLGWPFWFVLLQCLVRPWGVEIQEAGDDDDKLFVPLQSLRQAMQLEQWFEQKKTNKELPLPQTPSLVRDQWFVAGWLFFLFLLVNMFVTGALVVQCMDRGCCRDDEDTLDCCVETGYPDC